MLRPYQIPLYPRNISPNAIPSHGHVFLQPLKFVSLKESFHIFKFLVRHKVTKYVFKNRNQQLLVLQQQRTNNKGYNVSDYEQQRNKPKNVALKYLVIFPSKVSIVFLEE